MTYTIFPGHMNREIEVPRTETNEFKITPRSTSALVDKFKATLSATTIV